MKTKHWNTKSMGGEQVEKEPKISKKNHPED
jgi:hypothetical protein